MNTPDSWENRDAVLCDVLRLCRPFIVNAIEKQTDLGLHAGAAEDAILLKRMNELIGTPDPSKVSGFAASIMRERGDQ